MSFVSQSLHKNNNSPSLSSSFDLKAIKGENTFWQIREKIYPHIRTEYGEILRISPYSVWMRENEDQNNSKYGNVLRGAF